MNKIIKKAIAQYRRLDKIEKITYDPSGKHGADEVRRLQSIAFRLKKLSDAKYQAHANPQFSTSKLEDAKNSLFNDGACKWSKYPGLARDTQCMHIIPLGESDQKTARRHAHLLNPRFSNWL